MKNPRKLLLYSFLVFFLSNAMARKVQVLVGPDSFSPSEITVDHIGDTIQFSINPSAKTQLYALSLDNYSLGDFPDGNGIGGSSPDNIRFYLDSKASSGNYTFRGEYYMNSSKPFFYLIVHYGTIVEDHNHTINLGNSAFSPSTQIVAKGDTVKIKYADTNGDSYYITAPSGLSFSNTFLSSGELDISDAVKNATPGDYIITAQNFANATLNISFTLRIQAATSVDNYKLDKVSIAPNPVADVLSIKGLDKEATLSVYNLAGVLQMQKQLAVSNADVDVSNLNAGVYVVKLLTSDGGSFETKIVKL